MLTRNPFSAMMQVSMNMNICPFPSFSFFQPSRTSFELLELFYFRLSGVYIFSLLIILPLWLLCLEKHFIFSPTSLWRTAGCMMPSYPELFFSQSWFTNRWAWIIARSFTNVSCHDSGNWISKLFSDSSAWTRWINSSTFAHVLTGGISMTLKCN